MSHPAWQATGGFALASIIAESGIVRDLIAISALVVAVGIIWTRVIRPATVIAGLPARLDRLETTVDNILDALTRIDNGGHSNG